MTIRKISLWIGLVTGVIAIIDFIVKYFNDNLIQGFVNGAILLVLASVIIYISINGLKFPSALKSKTISVQQAMAMLADTFFDEKLKTLKELVDYLPDNLSGSDVQRLLEDLYFDVRVEAIRVLAPKIKNDLSREEVEWILDTLIEEERRRANRYLLRKDN